MEIRLSDSDLKLNVSDITGGSSKEQVFKNCSLIFRNEGANQATMTVVASEMPTKKRNQTDLENEELRQLTHYLMQKIGSLEQAIRHHSDGEECKVVFPDYDDELEFLQRKYLNAGPTPDATGSIDFRPRKTIKLEKAESDDEEHDTASQNGSTKDNASPSDSAVDNSLIKFTCAGTNQEIKLQFTLGSDGSNKVVYADTNLLPQGLVNRVVQELQQNLLVYEGVQKTVVKSHSMIGFSPHNRFHLHGRTGWGWKGTKGGACIDCISGRRFCFRRASRTLDPNHIRLLALPPMMRLNAQPNELRYWKAVGDLQIGLYRHLWEPIDARRRARKRERRQGEVIAEFGSVTGKKLSYKNS